MAIGKQEAGGAVVKGGGIPTGGVVAVGAIGGGEDRAGTGVRRIIGLLPLRHVAVLTGSGSQIVIVVNVALFTGDVGVTVGEREAGAGMIEGGAQPAIELVAGLAICRGESRASLGVVRIGGVLPVFQVAGIALCGKAEINPGASRFVARLAWNGSVSAEERKAILVIFYLTVDRGPTLDGVALGAVGPHLAAVNVRVAVRAILAGVGEDGLDVALDAGNFLVHATQRIVRFVVIKLGNRPDGAPAGGSVAILARDVDRSMRVARGLRLSRG